MITDQFSILEMSRLLHRGLTFAGVFGTILGSLFSYKAVNKILDQCSSSPINAKINPYKSFVEKKLN
jgi:hypothetical protein